LESVAVPGLMLSLGLENAVLIQETFKLSKLGPVFLVATQPLYVGYIAVFLPLLVMTLGDAGLI
jgi:hypothetical protein